MWNGCFALFALGLSLCLLPTNAHAHRVALIIGNDDYRAAHSVVPRLYNAASDAQMIGQAAREIGFTDVRVVLNASSNQIRRELEDFYVRASNAEVGFIYFAGHGFSLPGRTGGFGSAMQTTGSAQFAPAPSIAAGQNDYETRQQRMESGLQRLDSIYSRRQREAVAAPPSAAQSEMSRVLGLRESSTSTYDEAGYTGFITGTDWDGRSEGGLPIADALLALQRASRIVVVIDACRSPPIPDSAGSNTIVIGPSGRILRSVHGQWPMELPNLFFAASTSNGFRTPEGEPGANTRFAQTFARLMREHGASQQGFGERLRDEVSAERGAEDVPFFISNLQSSGNPLRISDDPLDNSHAARPVLETSLTVPSATEAIINDAGRIIVLHEGNVTDGAGRSIYQSSANEHAIAISPDGSKILAMRSNPLRIGVPRGDWVTPRERIEGERILAAQISNTGDYVVATSANRLIGHNDLYRGYFPTIPADRPLQIVAASNFFNNRIGYIYYGTRRGSVCLQQADGSDSPMMGAGWCRPTGTSGVRDVVESPTADGNFLMITEAGRVQLRTVQYGHTFAELPTLERSSAISADWSFDGRSIVVGFNDGSVSIWNADSTALLAQLPASPGRVLRAHFSPDGARIIVVRDTGLIQVWRSRIS